MACHLKHDHVSNYGSKLWEKIRLAAVARHFFWDPTIIRFNVLSLANICCRLCNPEAEAGRFRLRIWFEIWSFAICFGGNYYFTAGRRIHSIRRRKSDSTKTLHIHSCHTHNAATRYLQIETSMGPSTSTNFAGHYFSKTKSKTSKMTAQSCLKCLRIPRTLTNRPYTGEKHPIKWRNNLQNIPRNAIHLKVPHITLPNQKTREQILLK